MVEARSDRLGRVRLLYLGTDLRVPRGALGNMWTKERRDAYLLDPTVPHPLSVDRAVWPRAGLSVTQSGEATHLHVHPEVECLPWVPADIVTARARAWAEARDTTPPFELVVLGVAAESDDAIARCGEHRGTDRTLVVDPHWTFFGWDVADGSAGVSGLCNCGYTTEGEMHLARAEWAARLNCHGLFDTLEHAHEFRALCNLRVREHTPFFVMGLWGVVDGTA